MKIQKRKNIFFIVFIVINVLFIFLQIHKQSYIVKFYYEKQKLEKEKDQLIQTRNLLNKELYELKKPNNIMNYATENLNMKKINLNQIKKIKLNE